MNYATIKWTDIANGEGVRVSLFVSGCTHRCKNCFNREAWDFSYGKPFDETIREKLFSALGAEYIAGLSLLGGEPLEPQNQRALLPFVQNVRASFPNKTIWCYTGFSLDSTSGLLVETEKNTEITPTLLSCFDVLVDGAYIEELKDIRLKFRGSSNQRILDVKKTLLAKEPVFYLE